MSISKKKRFDVFRRDSFTCQYCGKRPPGVVLEVDHIQPVSKGGSDEEYNLITSCFDCNRGKTNTDIITEAPKPVEDLVAEQSEKIAQLAAFNELLMQTEDIREKAVERINKYWSGQLQCQLSGKQLASIRMFYKRLNYEAIVDAIDATVSRCSSTSKSQVFKYFCGVCWNMIKQQEGGE
mgnify:CR=1 FL=1